MDNFTDLNKQFSPLNICMYCGSKENLTKEHIVPFGLGGPGAIPSSSCKICAKKTSKFERHVLRGPMWGLRAHLGIKSRRPKDMPKTLPIILIKNDGESEVDLPIEEHPVFLHFPIFAPPSKLTNEHVEGIKIKGINTYGFGAAIPDVLKKYNARDIRSTEQSKPVSFARLIAKIAWCVAVAEGYMHKLDPQLSDAIINNPNNIGKFVGTYTDPLVSTQGMLHEIRLREDGKYLFADVQLFCATQTPRYGVILGELEN